MTEDYTPSILIEPPPTDSNGSEQGLFSLGMFDNNYCPPSEQHDTSNSCYPQPPALFIQPSESLSISTELSPLDELLHPEFGFSPATSGRSSPVGGWSPVSTYSNDIFPEDLNEDFTWSQQQYSAHSSPALSPSSLSPLTSALDGFGLEDNYPAEERTLLDGPPAFSRLRSRSSSHSVQTVSPAEFWPEGVGRGRSASFSGTQTDESSQFYPKVYSDNTEVQISVANLDTRLSDSLGTGLSWGLTSPQHDNSSLNAAVENPAPGTLMAGWTYPNRDGSTESQDRAPPSPSLLTVPNAGVGLRRRGACSASSRRTLSHSDINSLMPPDLDVGRGRGQHRPTLSIPNSRSVSNGSRASSRDVSPHGVLPDLPAFTSYSPSAPSSPAFEDADINDDREGSIFIGRRRTFTAMRGSDEFLPSVSPAMLSRAISTPTRARRSRAIPSSAGLGVFKAEQHDMSSFLSSLGTDISRQEFRVSQPALAPSFKAEVASKKIRQASNARRLNDAAFECPHCPSTFTARHNLTNHINSHLKHRPYKCTCSLAFTTQGVLNRHKKRCRK